jgi:chorismate-pyruvate lyase
MPEPPIARPERMFAPASGLPPQRQPAPGWAGLLERFYGKLGLPLPALLEVSGSEMPQPYRDLLVHSADMTPTLEAFYHQPMRLSVLTREQHDSYYLREVVLKSAEDSRPVEYGVIRISLNHLPPPASLRVLEEQRPLGNILQKEGIPHLSWPQSFFSVQPDSHLGHVLYLSQPGLLYGRRNVLLDGSRRLLAEVIEILAPAP